VFGSCCFSICFLRVEVQCIKIRHCLQLGLLFDNIQVCDL
jgi:hypothetical protein